MNERGLAMRPEVRLWADTVAVGILVFFLGHMAIRLFGTSNFSVDETMTAIHTQRFHLVYLLRNPPMFDWLYYGLSRVMGSSLLTMQILKTALLGGGAVFFYLGLKPNFSHRAALVAAMASYGATAFYGWEILQIYSHTNALIFALGFTFWAFMRVVSSCRTADYLLLGIGFGIGMLSKYLFGLFFVALVVAALISPRYRSTVLSWRILLTLAVGVLLLSPVLYGLWGSLDEATLAIGRRVEGSEHGGMWLPLADFAIQSAQFWLPFAAILWVCLARWPAGREPDAGFSRAIAGDDDHFYVLLRNATLLLAGTTILAVLLLGTRITAGHYLVPVLSLLPAAVFAGIDRRQPFPATATKKYVQSAVALMAGIAIVRFLFFLFVSPPFCVPRCILFVDYKPVIEKLDRADGKQNVILSNDIHIASNLLAALPNSRVIVPTEAGGLGVGIAGADSRNCNFVWFRTYRGETEQPLESALRSLLRRPPTERELAAIGPIIYLKADWQTKLLRDRGPETIIGIATIDSASPLCQGVGVSAQSGFLGGRL